MTLEQKVEEIEHQTWLEDTGIIDVDAEGESDVGMCAAQRAGTIYIYLYFVLRTDIIVNRRECCCRKAHTSTKRDRAR